MFFSLIHEVGNRQRWRTSETLSSASAELIASEIAALRGLSGVVVNPRTGSIVVTYDTVEARGRLAAYIKSLIELPPIRRAERARYVEHPRGFTPQTVVVSPLTRSLEQKVEAVQDNRLYKRVKSAMRSGFENMPVRRMIIKPLISPVARQGRETARQRMLEYGIVDPAEAPVLSYRPPEAELDFGPLARFVVLNRFLPTPIRFLNLICGSLPFIWEGLRELSRGHLNTSVLDASAIGVSLIRADFRSADVILLLLGLGEMLEEYARKKSMASLAEQLAIKCDTVWVRTPGSQDVERRLLTQVTPEDIVVVRSGGVIPVDGLVTAGEAAVNQATMTGEPLAVQRNEGGAVFAGTVVESGEIDIKPTGIGSTTRLANIIRFVEDNEKVKAGVESNALRLADAIVPLNFALAILVFLVTRDMRRTASVLLVDYSCALQLATPLAILSGMREGTAEGVVVKGGRYLEALDEVDTVVFDKTGTLTSSMPRLSDVCSATPEWSESELLRLAACLEEHFPHPVSRAVVGAAEEAGLEHYTEQHDAKVQYVVAHGICSAVDGHKVVLGSRHFIEDDEGVDTSGAARDVQRLTGEGKTVLYMACANRLIGVLGIEDPIRPEAVEVIAELKRRGKHIVMLTGDDERTAAAVAAHLGLESYRSQVLPSDKSDEVLRLKAQGRKVLMVGDGINDSPALSASDVGVTLRDGTDIAKEVADVVLESSLERLILALDLGSSSMTRVRENVNITIGLNSLFLAGGVLGVLSPMLAALLHNATTVGVCLNAMRAQIPHTNKHDETIVHQIRYDVCDLVNRLKKPVKSRPALEAPATPAI